MPSAVASRLIRIEGDGCEALVYPEQGFQLHGFRAVAGGKPVDLIFGPTGEREPFDRRYGNPVLFPSVGVTTGAEPDRWLHRGRGLPMQQHGWARDAYWHVEAADARAVTGVLVPTTGIKTSFPFGFELRLRYAIEDGALALAAELANPGDQAFPYALGFHPYLRARAQSRVKLPAGTRLRTADGWRTIDRTPVAARELRVDDAERPVSIVLAETAAGALEVEDADAGIATRVATDASHESFSTWVAWTGSADHAYVCLEPWTDAPNALNRPGTRTLAPGATHRYRMTIAVRALGGVSNSSS